MTVAMSLLWIKEIKLPKVLQGLYLFLMARKDWMIWTASFLKKICPFPVSPRVIGHISRFSKTAYAILHVWKWCNLSDTWTRNQKTSLYVWKTLGLSASCLKICSVYFWWSAVEEACLKSHLVLMSSHFIKLSTDFSQVE